MRQSVLLFCSFLLFSAMLQAQNLNLFDKLVYTSKKDTLPYRLLKPSNPDVGELFPLVIFFHGIGERGNDNEAQLKHIGEVVLDPKFRAKHLCYIVAPQCAQGEMWAKHNKNGTTRDVPTLPMQLVIELIGKLCEELPIDKNRIYVTGLSMGGYGAWDLLVRYPNKFAAAVPICGGGDEMMASRIKHIPIWAFHGAKDEVVSPRNSRTMIKALQDSGGSPGYTEYPDIGHNSWVQAYREPYLFPWLFKQSLQTYK
jgi:predicted peptidase